MGRLIYRRKNIVDAVRIDSNRITELENQTRTLSPATATSLGITQTLSFLFEATSFTQASDNGEIRINATTTPTSAVDEETNTAVKAYLNFDGYGSTGGAAAIFDSPLTDIPLTDDKGKQVSFRTHANYAMFDDGGLAGHPVSVTHTRAFLASHSAKFHVGVTPSTAELRSIIYYIGSTDFNLTANISVSLWFYPTDTSQIAAETFRYLLYRWIDASNYYMILIKPSDQKVYVFVNEAAAVTKLVSAGTVNLNAWNNIIFTYNPTTNALVIYLNNSSASSTPADTPPVPYTGTELLLANIVSQQDKRFTGFIDNFVFWSGKILTGTEATNMWNHGTII